MPFGLYHGLYRCPLKKQVLNLREEICLKNLRDINFGQVLSDKRLNYLRSFEAKLPAFSKVVSTINTGIDP
jgi:hypothetical protein